MAAAIVVLAALAAGSLAPFRFDPHRAWAEGRIGRLGFPHSDARDVGLNLVAYAVVGIVLAAASGGRRQRFGPVGAIVAATFGGAATSVLLELGQTMLPGRYASWIDVGVNTAGAALGALAWCWFTHPRGLPVRRGALRSREGGTRYALDLAGLHRPAPASRLADAWWGRADVAHGWDVVSRALMFGLMLAALAPFDFAGTAESFGRALRRAELPPSAAVWGGRLLPDGPAPLLHSVMLSGDVLLALGFALLAAATLRGRLARGGALAEAAGAALGRSALIAVLAETLQLFSSHHSFDILDLARNLAATVAGLMLAALTTRAIAHATSGA